MKEKSVSKVRIVSLWKSFEKKGYVLKDINLEVKDGEFLVLLGPSGCGKSTLLRIISGLEKQDKGDLYIGEKLVNKIPPKDRNIAMVFQSYALYPHMTVYENIAFALKLRGYSKDYIKRKVEEVAELLGIKRHLKSKPKELSGGERQRVAVGRAIVRNPEVFLFDEPLSNLDAKLRTQMRSEFKKLHQRLKTTTIYVTHDQIEAMTLGERIVILKKGEIQQIGTPHEVFFYPENVFVAGFLGTPPMNFVEGEFKDNWFLSDDLKLKLKNINLSSGNYILGVRPSDINLSEESQNGIPAKVILKEVLGNEFIYHLKVSKFVFKAKSKVDLKDENCFLSFDEKKLFFFLSDTQKRVYP